MSCCGPAVIGGTCDDQINYGETIDLSISYANENGTPIDLTTALVEVFSSVPELIKEKARISIADAAAGKVRFYLSAADAMGLRRGMGNRFALRATFGSQSDDVTPDIYLQVT